MSMVDGLCKPCGRGLACAVGCKQSAIARSASDISVGSSAVSPQVLAGYFTKYEDPFSVYLCREEKACPGGPPESCLSHRQGIACGSCDEGYFQDTTGLFVECDSIKKVRGLSLGIPWISVLLIFLMTADEKDVEQWFKAAFLVGPLVYIILWYMQTLASYSIMSLTLPSGSRALTGSFMFLVDWRSIVRPQCAEFNTFESNFAGILLIPAYFALIVAFAYVLSIALGKAHVFFRRRGCVMVSFYGASYSSLFLTISSLTFSLFACYPHPNGKSSLRSAPAVLCNTDQWRSMVGAGVAGILVYCVFALSLMAFLIWAARKHYGSITFRLATKFLFVRFRIGCAYWSVLLLIKALAISLTTVLWSDPTSQLMWMDGVVLIYVPMVTSVMPWRSRWLTYADVVSNVALVFAFALGGFFSSSLPTDEEVISRWLIAVTVLTALTFLASSVSIVVLGVRQTFQSAQYLAKVDSFARDFCLAVGPVVNDPQTISTLVKVLPDVEVAMFSSMLHIFSRETGSKTALKVLISQRLPDFEEVRRNSQSKSLDNFALVGQSQPQGTLVII